MLPAKEDKYNVTVKEDDKTKTYPVTDPFLRAVIAKIEDNPNQVLVRVSKETEE
jgi:hypothetical protein